MAAKSDGPATTLLIPVSWGEFFDKISILEIKKENVLDGSAKNNIVVELELLNNFLSADVLSDVKLNNLRVKLKAINQKLWNIEDEIRVNEAKKDFSEKFIWLARSTYINNDIRASIKRQINEALNSAIVEEKIY
ncbi:MAG: hypothetical protein HOK17_00655 [Flammeovirgaceae bacterium]|jgi:hypothetical protein|nr:hypothetical protein [Flammeovirgaceae bacterium]